MHSYLHEEGNGIIGAWFQPLHKAPVVGGGRACSSSSYHGIAQPRSRSEIPHDLAVLSPLNGAPFLHGANPGRLRRRSVSPSTAALTLPGWRRCVTTAPTQGPGPAASLRDFRDGSDLLSRCKLYNSASFVRMIRSDSKSSVPGLKRKRF